MGAIGASNNNLMQRTPATVSRAGSNLMPGNAATTSTRQRITPENYRQVLGAEADVLLSPQDLKNLYEKGYMDVQRQFQTAESNEGFLTLASKLGAALVGPSRSVGAIQIDPLFLEMIKDPNAQSGFGYTRVKSETLSIIAPTEYKEPTTPSVPKPKPHVPILGTDPLKRFRDESTKEVTEEIIEETFEEQTISINGLSTAKSYAGKAVDGQSATEIHNNNVQDSTVLGSVQEQYELYGRGEDAQLANSVVYNFFTGDMGRLNKANRANNIIGNIGRTKGWADKRIDSQHTTNNKNNNVNQFSGKKEYGFLTTQGNWQKLEGPMLDEYKQMAGENAKENPTVFDMYVATRQDMTLGAPPSQAEALVNGQAPEGESSQMEANQQELQDKFKALHQKAFPGGKGPDGKAYDLDAIAKSASMEDLYALGILVETGTSPDKIASAIAVDGDGNISLKPDANKVFGKILHLPENQSGSEMVATYSMLMEANYQDDSGEMLLSTDNDTESLKALHQKDYEAKGQGDRLASFGATDDNTAGVTNMDSKVGQMESSHKTEGAVNKPTSNEGTWTLADGTNLAGTLKTETQSIESLTAAVQGSTDKASGESALAGIKTLKGAVLDGNGEPKPHDKNYQRSTINRTSRNVRAALDKMPADDPARASLEKEYSRIMDIDSAMRGQFRQSFAVNGSEPKTTTRTETKTVVTERDYYKYDDVISSVTSDNSAIDSWVNQSGKDSNFVLRDESVDDYKDELGKKIGVIKDILKSPETETEKPLTTEQISELKALQAKAEANLAILENPPEKLQASIDKGNNIVSGRAEDLSKAIDGNPDVSETEGSFKVVNNNIDDLNKYMKQALADGSINTKEKGQIKDILDNMSQDIFTSLKSKGVDVTSPLDALNMSRETLIESKKLSESEVNAAVNVLDRLKTAQSTIGLVGESKAVNNIYQGVRSLTRKLDSFDEVQVAKKAFSGELKTLATEKPEVFDDFISSVYGIDKTKDNEKQFNEIREAAQKETLPFPPNIEIVDRADINGANGAYVSAVEGDETEHPEKIMLSRDLLANPEKLNEVFKEEMFHHLEHLDAVQTASGTKEFEAKGDEGRAALAIMKEIHSNNGETSLDDMKRVGNKARGESASVQTRGNITMNDKASDAGVYTGDDKSIGQRIEFSSDNPQSTATDATTLKENPVNPISELAEVDMEIGSSNPYAQREVADVPQRDPGNTTNWSDNGFSEPTVPEGPVEEKGAFDMATLIKGFPDGLIAAGQMFTTLADKIQAIVDRDFKGGVAKNLANASSLMKTATDAIYGEGGYHGNDRDAAVGRNGGYEMGRINLSRRPNSNWGADPSYANQTPEQASSDTYKQRKAHDDATDAEHKRRVEADNARNV